MNITQPSFEVPADMRDFVEKSVEQARTAISAFMQNARRATKSLQAQTKTTELPASVAYVHGLELFEQNLAAAFEVALQIQSEYVRAQFATLQSQTRELASAAQPAKAA
ncbi:phasin [Methylorubrum extorquens]